MGYYLTPTGGYYEGDKADVKDFACAKRPTSYVLNGTLWQTDPLNTLIWRALNQTEIDVIKDANAAGIINGPPTIHDIVKAFALVVLDEINLLRAQHALAARTPSQLKTAVRNKLGDA